MATPLLAVLAAYLGFCFQRRNSYLQALRDLWKILIPAVQRAVQYTHLEQPDPNEFSELMRELSTVIDSLRGVFKNVPGPGVGLYPYEPIKDILTTVGWVHEGKSPHERYLARQCIINEWYGMHSALLKEFDRSVPVEPVSKYIDGKTSLSDKLKNGTLSESDFRLGPGT